MNVVKALNLKNIICGEFILDDKYVNNNFFLKFTFFRLSSGQSKEHFT